MLLGPPHGGQGRIYRVARRVVLDVAVSLAIAEHDFDPLADPASCFGFGGPDRLQDGQHVSSLDAIHRHGAELGHGVIFETADPAVGVFGVAPARQVSLMHRLSSIAENGYVAAALLGDRVAFLGDSNAQVVGAVARVGFGLFVKVQVKTPKIDQVFSFPLSFPRCHGHVTGGQSEASAVSKAMMSALRV